MISINFEWNEQLSPVSVIVCVKIKLFTVENVVHYQRNIRTLSVKCSAYVICLMISSLMNIKKDIKLMFIKKI